MIRLHHFVRVPYRNRVPLSRRAVFARDGHRCQYCNRAAENIDHVVPRSRGGPHAWDNVVASCRACNARKEDRLLAEADLRLAPPPREPHANLWVVATAGSHRPGLGALPPRASSDPAAAFDRSRRAPASAALPGRRLNPATRSPRELSPAPAARLVRVGAGAEKGAMWVEQWGEGCRVPRSGVKW